MSLALQLTSPVLPDHQLRHHTKSFARPTLGETKGTYNGIHENTINSMGINLRGKYPFSSLYVSYKFQYSSCSNEGLNSIRGVHFKCIYKNWTPFDIGHEQKVGIRPPYRYVRRSVWSFFIRVRIVQTPVRSYRLLDQTYAIALPTSVKRYLDASSCPRSRNVALY